ncbi:hypothetical protein PtB15_16B406 [Puccinia triticina]|nr:hypothetical protein PtB15_16B406 [Puccinia triticina]
MLMLSKLLDLAGITQSPRSPHSPTRPSSPCPIASLVHSAGHSTQQAWKS